MFRRMMGWEGEPSAINAFDRANITLGAGFAGSAGGAVQQKGQAQELMGDLLKRSPEAAGLFSAAGLTVLDGELVVVDPARKWKPRGMDAELYFRAKQRPALALRERGAGQLLEDKANAPHSRRPAAGGAGRPTSRRSQPCARGQGVARPRHRPRGAQGHAAHSGNIAWSEVSSFASIPELVRFIYSRVSREQADALVVEPK